MTTETNDLILKIIGIIVSVLLFRWLKNIYAGADKKLSGKEFGHLAGFLFFMWAAVYVIIMEANRINPEKGHLFNDIWLFFLISGLLTVLHLEAVMDKFIILLRLLIELRSKTITTTAISTEVTKESVKQTKEVTDEPQ